MQALSSPQTQENIDYIVIIPLSHANCDAPILCAQELRRFGGVPIWFAQGLSKLHALSKSPCSNLLLPPSKVSISILLNHLKPCLHIIFTLKTKTQTPKAPIT